MESLRTKAASLTKKRLLIESLALLLIISTPFVFKSHEYFPVDPDETISFLGIEITRNGFSDIGAYIWFLLGKIIPLYLLVIWFFTCKHWWYHTILIPICMYAFQIFEAVYFDDPAVDTENVLWILPICMVIIPFVYFIRLKLFDKYVHGIDLEAMNAELQYYKTKEREQMQKAGIYTDEGITAETVEQDLSDATPKRTINQLLNSVQASLRSLF